MSIRPSSIWQTETVAALYRDVDKMLRRYEAYCHEAIDRAPVEWQRYWRDEAQAASTTRRHLLHRVSDFLEYAAGKDVQVLGKINASED